MSMTQAPTMLSEDVRSRLFERLESRDPYGLRRSLRVGLDELRERGGRAFCHFERQFGEPGLDLGGRERASQRAVERRNDGSRSACGNENAEPFDGFHRRVSSFPEGGNAWKRGATTGRSRC